MSDLQALTVVTISAAILFGMVLALLGSLKLALARRLHIGEGRVGGLIAALNLALIPMMLFCGLLVDLLGIQFILLLGSVFTALALFSIGVSPTYRRAMVSTFVAGLGAAGLCSGAIVLMPHAFYDYGTTVNLSPALNLGHVFIALGALITPALVDVLLGLLSFRRVMILLGILALVPGILSFVLLGQDLLDKHPVLQGQRAFPTLVGPNVSHLGMAALVFFFYAPLEAAIAVWTTTYLTEHGSNEHEAAWLLSGFWTMFMLSRLMVAFVRPQPGYDPWIIALAALAAAAMLGNLASTASGTIGRFGILLLGFSLGPIFPTLIGIIFRDFPNERGTAHGVIFAVGSAAGLLLGPIMGMRMQKGSQSVFAIPLALSLGLLLSAVIFAIVVGRGG
jgi:fucose permease